ncbi:MAG: hypothetical protein IPK67_18770 [Planctomycetes bacterium]|nr:hypothetical protein [Planctomycetota bacterium]
MSTPPRLLSAVELLEQLAEAAAAPPRGIPTLASILERQGLIARGLALALRRLEALSSGRAGPQAAQARPAAQGQPKPSAGRLDEPAAQPAALGHPWRAPPLSEEELGRLPVGSAFGLRSGRWLWQGPRLRWAFTPWEEIPAELRRLNAAAQAALQGAGLVRLPLQASAQEALQEAAQAAEPPARAARQPKPPSPPEPGRRVLGPAQDRARERAEAEGERSGRLGEPASACPYKGAGGGYRGRWLLGHARGGAKPPEEPAE